MLPKSEDRSLMHFRQIAWPGDEVVSSYDAKNDGGQTFSLTNYYAMSQSSEKAISDGNSRSKMQVQIS